MNTIKTYDVICDQYEDQNDATIYLRETYYEAEVTEGPRPTHSELVDTIEGGTLDIYYDYGADYYFCALNEEGAEHEMQQG